MSGDHATIIHGYPPFGGTACVPSYPPLLEVRIDAPDGVLRFTGFRYDGEALRALDAPEARAAAVAMLGEHYTIATRAPR